MNHVAVMPLADGIGCLAEVGHVYSASCFYRLAMIALADATRSVETVVARLAGDYAVAVSDLGVSRACPC